MWCDLPFIFSIIVLWKYEVSIGIKKSLRGVKKLIGVYESEQCVCPVGRLTVANPGADKERTYTYDAVGNLMSVDSPNVAWCNRIFGYDALNRLEHGEGPYGGINYTYPKYFMNNTEWVG